MVSESNDETTRKITTLVVDDDALIAISIVEMLEVLGHDTIEAASGDSALEILRDHRKVDLIVTDCSDAFYPGSIRSVFSVFLNC